MLMILLIARRDKCDLIFRRQLLSCFVSLPNLFKRRTTITLQSSAVSFCSQEKKEQNKNETKWLVFLFFDKFIKNYFFFLLLEEGIRFFEHLTLQLYTDGQFPSLHQHLRHWMLDYTHCYTKKREKKKENKGDRYRQLHCMYNILYREPKHHFFFTHEHQQRMIRIHSQYNNSPCWYDSEKTRETRKNNPTLVTA